MYGWSSIVGKIRGSEVFPQGLESVEGRQMGKISIGITGMIGFVGTHLCGRIAREKDVEIVDFEDGYFERSEKLREFVTASDVVVHLAAMNRGKLNEIIEVNVWLVQQLVSAMEDSGAKPYVIFSSSIQSDLDNPYGRSKKVGARILEEWANKNSAAVSVLTIPNVFGEGGRPHYNSVVATFCHEVTHGGKPEIHVDKEMGLIYVNELVELIWQKIQNAPTAFENIRVEGTARTKVSEVLGLLEKFKECYFEKKVVPHFSSDFERNLYSMFITYLKDEDRSQRPRIYSDQRGELFEIVKQERCGQVFYSTTKPGIVRGNHYHTRKMEKFCVVKGEAIIRLRRIGTEKVMEYRASGESPIFVEIPIFYTHNIENVGTDDLCTLFWTNELFDSDDPDTFHEEV